MAIREQNRRANARFFTGLLYFLGCAAALFGLYTMYAYSEGRLVGADIILGIRGLGWIVIGAMLVMVAVGRSLAEILRRAGAHNRSTDAPMT